MSTEIRNIEAVIPVDFYKNLNPFNCDTNGLKGGAFRLRALGVDSDGNPKRSRDIIFFGNGMISMAILTESTEKMFHDQGIIGYRYIFEKKPSKSKDSFFWNVISPQEDTTVYHHTKHSLPTLRVSGTKPNAHALSLIMIEAEVGQYFYIE